MSYDIRFGVKVAGAKDGTFAVIGQPERDNPTYNLGKMFRACTGWDYKQGEWYRLTDVLPKIEHGVHELRFNREAYRQYEPENGFGTISGALEALESILKWCSDSWDGIGGTWNAELPLDCLYICW